MRADLVGKLETIRRCMRPAVPSSGEFQEARICIHPRDVDEILKAAALALRALRDAPEAEVQAIDDDFGGTMLAIGAWDDKKFQHLEGQRVRLVVVGEEG